MTDFWLTRDDIACDFVDSIDDVIAVSPPGSWRLVSRKGWVFPTDHRLLITRDSDTSGTLEVIDPISSKVSLKIMVSLWFAPADPHKGEGHFFVSADETIFLFKFTDEAGIPGVLVQHYLKGGAHWKTRPTTTGALKYVAPLAGARFLRSNRTDGPVLEQPTATQDDEGGGYVP